MIYTNYDPTPTPDVRVRFYQHMPSPLADALSEYHKLPDWVMGKSTPEATTAKAGVVFAPKPFMRNLVSPSAVTLFSSRYEHLMDRSTELSDTHGLLGRAGTNRLATTSSDVDDAAGAGWQANGTEVAPTTSGHVVASRSTSWTSGQFRNQWGWYYRIHFKLPTQMTSLSDRAFNGGISVSGASDTESLGADTGGTTTARYVYWRWRHGTDAGFVVRCGDGSNDSNSATLSSTPPVTDTEYIIELWKLGSEANIKARLNGGAAVTVSMTNAPSATADFTSCRFWRAQNLAAVTGSGNIGFISYGASIVSWG